MKPSKNDVKLGKFISLVLRHGSVAAGITLDKNGWANTKELLSGINRASRRIDMATLECIVRGNKKRYRFNEAYTKIRANQEPLL